MPTKITPDQAPIFRAYFDVADEIYEAYIANIDLNKTGKGKGPDGWLTTLADLDIKYVAQAEKAVNILPLPWPPYLPAAEELALDNVEVLR